VSCFCGALTLAPAHGGAGGIVSIIAVVWFVAELLRMSARNHWRALRSLPRPRWNLTEAMLMCVAVLVGGLVGPHLLATRSNAPLTSWGLAGAVTVTVATLLFAANASFRHRAARAWPR
jgi:Mn2+/Fe2+ NRAMP family transporter